ncbi:penicillin-binding protein 1C [Aquabacterium sp.]|uniref:penicillin-binding protein 1C n=1 Tax=Aquabacterium sp. TaxID=1872578 RepID=UPI00248A1AFA|nr:penicillin-binding protein 1C [Aquabacterium sp.]MDI1258488.1 penicillin-binding protein 1C [Aquabacterium sp.]
MSARRRLGIQRAAWAALALILSLGLLDRLFPLPLSGASGGSLVVVANDGTPLRVWPSRDGALRQQVTLKEVSPLYLQALLRYEDHWFYWHPGVNPWAMARAAWQWGRHGRIVSGGSTLTMQVARIIDPALAQSGQRSLRAKLRQIARALQLEVHLSKSEILALYVNHAPMGGQVEGVEMASRAYLGKGCAQLSPAEAALLVALPQTPSRLRPDRAPGLAQSARDKVLRRMESSQAWSSATVNDARLERVFAPPLRARWLAPLAAERLRSEHRHARNARPAVIRSNLDPGIQMSLERVLLDRLTSLPDKVSIAALVVENDSLAVRGYAGSADFTDNLRSAHVDMVRGVRSPGSTLKPFLYAMALDDGLVHSESLLIDAPQNFGGYAPGNFQASFSGAVSVSDALQRSLNVPAVDLLERIGPARFAAHLRQAGVKLRMPSGADPNLSIILGGAGTTLEELVGAYTALARGGVAGQPRLTPDSPLVETRLMSPGAAFIVREILENGGRPDAPFRESSDRIAWKTGTSFGFRDAWAVGVTDRYTVGVWVGRPDGTPNPGHFGANTSAPLVKDLLKALGPTATKPRTVPAQVHTADICWPLGLSSSATPADQCRVRRTAWTLEGATPPTLPDRVQGSGLLDVGWVDPVHGRRWRPGCAPAHVKLERTEFARWPTLLQPWIGKDMRSPVENLPWSPACGSTGWRHTLHVAGIEPGSVLRPTPGQKKLTFRVQAIGTREPVTWLLDGLIVGATSADSTALQVTLDRAGEHALTALDTQGRFERVPFSVR